MIRLVQKKSLAILAIFGILFGGIEVAQAGNSNTATERYIVSFSNDEDVQGESNDFRSKGIKVHATFTQGFKGVVGDFTQAQLSDLKKNPKFMYAEKDAPVYANLITVNPTVQTSATWGLDRIDQRGLPLSTSYSYTSNGEGVSAYVIDTGLLSTHTQFTGRVSAGQNFAANTTTSVNVSPTNTNDCNGHGTHVAGTIGGSTSGVAKGVTIIPVRVLDCTGSGTTSGVIAGINWVISHHQAGIPAVANLSLGGGLSNALNTAIANLIADGVVVAVAAGNDNLDACLSSPASAPNAITVGASEIRDNKAAYSNFGRCLDIFAPGSSITSSWIGASNTATATISGTSMASPHVAGAAALLLEVNKTATPQQIRDSLVNNSTCGAVTSSGTGSPNNLLATSTASALACPPPTISSVAISTNPRVGSAVTSTVSVSGATPITLSYQWQIAATSAGPFSNIALATASSYTPVSADQSRVLRVVVGASNVGGSAIAVTSAASTAIQIAPAITAVTISSSGAFAVNSILTANATATGFPIPTYTYQWQSATSLNGTYTNIANATARTYTLPTNMRTRFIRVQVRAVNAVATTAAFNSSSVGPIA